MNCSPKADIFGEIHSPGAGLRISPGRTSQLGEEVNGGGGLILGEAERTAGEKGQVEVEARGLG